MQAAKKETALSSLAVEFVKASVSLHKINILKSIFLFFIFPIIGTISIMPEIIRNLQTDRAKQILMKIIVAQIQILELPLNIYIC
jgi:hypothetical protein